MDIEKIKAHIDSIKKYTQEVHTALHLTEIEVKLEKESNFVEAVVKPASTGHQKIYDMGLHQVIDISEIDNDYRPFRYVMRVAGGWIYCNYDTDKDIYTDKLFVPFNNDMQKTELPY